MPFDSLPAEKPETDEARWLREAMDVIGTRDKWTKHHLHCGGSHCLLGAVLVAMGRTDQELDDFQAGVSRLAEPFPLEVGKALDHAVMVHSGRYWSFPQYNDRSTTSHADVMAVMQAAYEHLRWGDSE